jgi:lysophospholipase L1-like esterase
MRMFFALMTILIFADAAGVQADERKSPDLHLTVPPAIYAVVGQPTSIYFDNIVLTERPADFQFKVEAEIGQQEERRWTFTPEQKHIGSHRLRISVADKSGRSLGRVRTDLQVVAADAAAGRELKLLIVGDSLTHATAYTNDLAKLLTDPGKVGWKMLGTHRPANAGPGVAHEGYGGWTWQRFAEHYDPQGDQPGHIRSSPFVVPAGGDQKPALDVGRYFDAHCGGERPDVVLFLLGINDCFGAPPDDPQALDARIDAVLRHADTLLAAFRKAAPRADLAIGLTTPPNVREEAFVANYKGNYHRWGWKRIQHRLVEREIEHWDGRDTKRLFLVPTELDIDPIDGYPENNAVHPNAVGYRQIAGSLYAWLLWRVSTRE